MTRNDSKGADKGKAGDKVDSRADDTVVRDAEPTIEQNAADQADTDRQDSGYEVNQQRDPLHVQPSPVSEDPAELAVQPGRRDG